MNTAGQLESPPAPACQQSLVRLPLGLLGFETIKQYVLTANPGEEPFQWFEMLEEPKHVFLVISPFTVFPDYQPDISDEDVNFLALKSPHDALVLNITTMRQAGSATVNLKGPIVINRHTLVGKQVILVNASRYELQEPLPVVA